MTVRMLLHPSTLTAFAGALSFLAVLTTVTVILITHGTDDVFAQQQSMNGDLDLHSDNGAPRGIWSDRSTIWVADLADRKLYAYALASGTRQDTKDIDLSSINVKPYGIWGSITKVVGRGRGGIEVERTGLILGQTQTQTHPGRRPVQCR